MNKKEIKEKIISGIIEQLCIDTYYTSVTSETDIRKDLGVNSLDSVELIMRIEEAFDIEIEDNKWTELKTVQDITDHLCGVFSITK